MKIGFFIILALLGGVLFYVQAGTGSGNAVTPNQRPAAVAAMPAATAKEAAAIRKNLINLLTTARGRATSGVTPAEWDQLNRAITTDYDRLRTSPAARDNELVALARLLAVMRAVTQSWNESIERTTANGGGDCHIAATDPACFARQSRIFYEAGFVIIGLDANRRPLFYSNDSTTIGPYQEALRHDILVREARHERFEYVPVLLGEFGKRCRYALDALQAAG